MNAPHSLFARPTTTWPVLSLVIAASAALLLAGCGPSNEKGGANATSSPLPTVGKAVPFTAEVRADVDGAFVVNNLAGMFDALLDSKFLAEIFALEPMKEEFAEKGVEGSPREIVEKALAQDPKKAEGYSRLRGLLGQEIFFAVPNGGGARWREIYELAEEIRAAQLGIVIATAAAKGVGEPNTAGADAAAAPPAADNLKQITAGIGPILVDRAERFSVPQFVVGLRTDAAVRPWFKGEIKKLETELPAKFTKSEVQVPGGRLVKLTATVADFLDEEKRAELGKELRELGAQVEGGEALAARLEAAILSKKLEAAYGFLGDRFVVAFSGAESAVFAGADGERLSDLAAVRPLDGFGSHPTHMFVYQSSDFLERFRPQLGLAFYAERLKDYVPRSLVSEEQLAGIMSDANRIDKGFSDITTGAVSPNVGLLFVQDGLRIESRGGFVAPLLQNEGRLPLAGLAAPSIGLFYGRQLRPDSNAVVYDWLVDVGATIVRYLKTFGLAHMPEEERRQALMGEQFISAQLTVVGGIIRDFLTKAVDTESAFYVDLGEQVPADGMIPAPVAGAGRVPHFGVIAKIKDEAALADVWTRLFNYASSLTMFLPPDAPIPRPLPQPTRKDGANGLASYVYPYPPMVGSDALGATISNGYLLLGTSVKVQERLAALIGTAPAREAALAADLRFDAVREAAAIWMDFLLANPEMASGPGATAEKIASDQKEMRVVKSVLELLKPLKNVTFERRETAAGPEDSFHVQWKR